MRVFWGFDALPKLRKPIVTVGSYDGVHAGHRALLGLIVEKAKNADAESVVITFSPHPRTVIHPELGGVSLLNSLKEKVKLLEEVGVDNLLVIPFTKEFSEVSSESFVRDFLIGKLGLATLIVGYNHHFGHNKSGTLELLETMRSTYGFEIVEIPKQIIDDHKVSSTVVRKHIEKGEMAQARACLTRPYFFFAHFDEGGCLLLDDASKLMPPRGCYDVEIEVEGSLLRDRLTVGDDSLALEKLKNNEIGADFIVYFV